MRSAGHASATSIEQRVARAAEAALREHGYVAAVDVLIGLGWLQPVHRDRWLQGREPCLEQVVQAGPGKVSAAMLALPRWAREQRLQPIETNYVARTRDRRTLQFSRSGDPALERGYRMHWGSPAMSEVGRTRIAEQTRRPPGLVVVSPLRDWSCVACGGTGEFLLMEDDAPLCLACADLDHLVYLPGGDAAVTRRARKASGLSAVVVRFSRSRKRYERQGILVEEPALADAEASCLADADSRARRRARDEQRRHEADADLAHRLAGEIRRFFPGCPPERAAAIAAHTATRGSGRIGPTAAGQRIDEDAVELAVVASVRHHDTDYNALLMAGVPRSAARAQVRGQLAATLDRWRRR